VISGLLVAAWMQVQARNRMANAMPNLLSAHALPLSLGVSD